MFHWKSQLGRKGGMYSQISFLLQFYILACHYFSFVAHILLHFMYFWADLFGERKQFKSKCSKHSTRSQHTECATCQVTDALFFFFLRFNIAKTLLNQLHHRTAVLGHLTPTCQVSILRCLGLPAGCYIRELMNIPQLDFLIRSLRCLLWQ